MVKEEHQNDCKLSFLSENLLQHLAESVTPGMEAVLKAEVGPSRFRPGAADKESFESVV